MNKKEDELLQEIINYVCKNKVMPTRRYLQNKLHYKSVNSISQYLKSLERQNYLTRNDEGKLILACSTLDNEGIKKIKIINTKNIYVDILLNKRKKYIAYKIHNNHFNNIGIYRNDILIIEIKKKLFANDLGLFIIDKKYRIMKYDYKDGFYILKDKEELLLNKILIIGKVIMIERKL